MTDYETTIVTVKYADIKTRLRASNVIFPKWIAPHVYTLHYSFAVPIVDDDIINVLAFTMAQEWIELNWCNKMMIICLNKNIWMSIKGLHQEWSKRNRNRIKHQVWEWPANHTATDIALKAKIINEWVNNRNDKRSP